MRVIAGQFKGRRLKAPKSKAVRPTTDKVKEAMFGALQFDILGACVLDAFAGSGALGIEALSRGAAHVDFVESNMACFKTLSENVADLPGTPRCSIHKGNVVTLMPKLQKYDILLLDPPYDDGLYGDVLGAASEHGILNTRCQIVMECRAKFDFLLPKEYNFTKRKQYGDISLWFLQYGE